MGSRELTSEQAIARRAFVRAALAAVATPFVSSTFHPQAAAAPANAPPNGLVFWSTGKEFRFATGALRGSLRSQGRSIGLMPVVESATDTTISQGMGLFSHYRLLDAENRYGHAAWDWSSRAEVSAAGRVETTWSVDAEHPFDMRAVYRWTAGNILDVTTTVVARRDLKRFEVFLSSYFQGFATSYVYVKNCVGTNGKPGFLEARRSRGAWQMFPRDARAVNTIQDGRWRRPPNPVDWVVMPVLAAPLAVRRDAETGLAALVMAPPNDCFAVATPYSGEGHRSLYLSLCGQDLRPDQEVSVRSRLIIDRGISDERAIHLYRAYLEDLEKEDTS